MHEPTFKTMYFRKVKFPYTHFLKDLNDRTNNEPIQKISQNLSIKYLVRTI
jgi:hypothetical protein